MNLKVYHYSSYKYLITRIFQYNVKKKVNKLLVHCLSADMSTVPWGPPGQVATPGRKLQNSCSQSVRYFSVVGGKLQTPEFIEIFLRLCDNQISLKKRNKMSDSGCSPVSLPCLTLWALLCTSGDMQRWVELVWDELGNMGSPSFWLYLVMEGDPLERKAHTCSTPSPLHSLIFENFDPL